MKASEPLLAAELGRTELQKYAKWVDEQEALYFTCWTPAIRFVSLFIYRYFSNFSSALSDDFKPTKKLAITPTTSQQIKERFQFFNTELGTYISFRKLYFPNSNLEDCSKLRKFYILETRNCETE
jgi:hypothetical protein